MSAIRSILLIAASVLLAAVVAGILTMVTWSACIEGRAFQCWDIGFGSFWQDIDVHFRAGDTISSGWSWERLKVVRFHYLEAFWLLWGLIAFVLFWILQKLWPNLQSPEHLTAVGTGRSAGAVHVASRRRRVFR